MTNHHRLRSSRKCPICKTFGPCLHDFEALEEQDITSISSSMILGCRNSINILEPQKILDASFSLPSTSSPVNTMPAQAYSNSVLCAFCNYSINENFLTDHLKIHRDKGILTSFALGEHVSVGEKTKLRIAEVIEEPKQLLPIRVKEEEEPHILKDGHWVKMSSHRSANTKIIPISKSFSTENIEEEEDEGESKISFIKLSELQPFSFRKVREITWLSSCSNDSRLSDVLVSIWFMPTPSAYNGTHYGATASSNLYYHERLNLHLIYDSRDNYYIVSSKILKRSVYNTFDSDEAVLPEYLCLPEELCSALKRILIYFRVPPRAVFKRFRKIMSDDFVIQYDENSGQAIFAHSNNHQKLLDETKTTAKFEQDDEDYPGWVGG